MLGFHRLPGLAVALLFGAGSVRAATCVDIDNTTQSQASQSQWTLKNTCDRAVDVSIISEGRRPHVCAVLRVDPGMSRTFKQEKVCHGGANELTLGCVCESRFTTQENWSR